MKKSSRHGTVDFYRFRRLLLVFRRDLPAVSKAIATACCCGWPSLFSLRILLPTVFWDRPLLSGMMEPLVTGIWRLLPDLHLQLAAGICRPYPVLDLPGHRLGCCP